MIRIFLIITIALFGCKTTSSINISKNGGAHSNDVLFTTNNETVTAQEFEYVYNKNNFNNDSAYYRSDIRQYLDLYINFKLKIQEAKQRGMDTTKAFIEEFNTYYEQLKKPYLTENKVTDRLVKEAYDRFDTEIRAAHILIKINNGENPEDTLAAYNKAIEARNKILKGEKFNDIANQYSQDPSVSVNNGDLGYFTSFQMVYPFESGAYKTEVGKISMPVRTRFGYHIIKVKDKRPSSGKVQVAHIMLRVKGDTLVTRNKIFEIYDQVKGGVPWEELVKQYSDDVNSKNTNGIIRPFSVGQMPISFQEAAFDLQNEGDISDPIKTQYGWHIIKLINKVPLESFEEMEPTIKSRISKDSRAQLNQKVLVQRLKKENGFEENQVNKDYVISKADSSLIKGNWTYSELNRNKDILFKVAGEKYTIESFINYVKQKQKASSYAPSHYLTLLYEEYQSVKIIDYEENHLADKYIDFRMIVKEYKEGILLFQLMEEEVWNKAVEDTVGLKNFYVNNSKNYQWGERLNANIYSSTKVIIDQIEKAIEKKDSLFLSKENLYKKYNSGASLTLQTDSGIFEKGSKEVLDQCVWQVGIQRSTFAGKEHLVWIKDVMGPQPKKFNETKGSVISDYQDKLEKEWLVKLKSKYTVLVNDEVLNKVYKSLNAK